MESQFVRDRYISALWYAWGQVDSGAYGGLFDSGDPREFAEEQKELAREFAEEERTHITSLQGAWGEFVERKKASQRPACDHPIELDEARDLLKRAVETKGRDFQYTPKGQVGAGCHYSPQPDLYDEGDPRSQTGCLVGVALGLAGIKVPEDSDTEAIQFLKIELGLSSDTTHYFQKAQACQDAGGTWGEAFDEAEAWVREKFGEAVS